MSALPMDNNDLFAVPDMDVQRDIAKQRRAAAQRLIQQSTADPNAHPLAAFAQGFAGSYMTNKADRDLKTEQDKYRQAEQAWLAEKPDALARTADPQLFERWLQKGQQFKDRAALEMQFANRADDRRFRHDEAQSAREFRAAEAEANRLHRSDEKERDRQFREQQDALYRRTAAAAAAAAGGRDRRDRWQIVTDADGSQHRVNLDSGEVVPVGLTKPAGASGSKGLTAKQLETQRGFMDLESSLNNYDKLLGEYDFQGKTAISPEKRAQLEGAFTDLQMKLKTLYELGAPQAGDLKLLEQSLSNPVSLGGTVRGAAFGSNPFTAKTKEIRGLLERSRENFETQLGKATPPAASSKPAAAPSKLTVGTVDGGYRYKGGNPSDPSSWEAVK